MNRGLLIDLGLQRKARSSIMPIVEKIPTFNSTGGNDATHMLHADAHISSALSGFAKTGLTVCLLINT